MRKLKKINKKQTNTQMLLDVSGVSGDHTSLDDIQALNDAIVRSGGKRITALHVQRNSLASLSTTAPLAMTLQHVTSLTASHNKLRTLQGVEAFRSLEVLDLSHNALRVLDAHSTSLLYQLKQLRQCDFSYNEIVLIDLDISHIVSTQGNSLDGDEEFSTPALVELTTLNLAHNQMIELPDLRCMPALEELNLEHNRIEYIADADNRLPLVALQTLSIGYNALGSLHSLLPLTVLAETLKALTVKGNPCMRNPAAAKGGCAVRPWLLWILPRLQTIDDTPVRAEERDVASKLFRHHGELSQEALEVMNTQPSGRLEAYLQRFACSQNTRPVTHTFSGRNGPQSTASVSDMNSLSHSVGGMVARLPTARNSIASTANSTIRAPSAEVVLQVMQKKLKQLSNVVEVLWKESISRRVFATIVLQKHMRGFLTRRHLHPSMQRICARIREKLRRARHHPGCVQQPQPPSPPLHVGEMQRVGGRTNNNDSSSKRNEYEALAQQVRRLESLVSHACAEMEEFQSVLFYRKNKAAITIQKHYRGYVDRKKWLYLKNNYDEFVNSLQPDVIALQRVCRGYLGRVKLMQSSRLRQLEVEVARLRRTVEEIKLLMEQNRRQQRLERYADPERAMEDIISRHVPQLTERVFAEEQEETDVALHSASSSVL